MTPLHWIGLAAAILVAALLVQYLAALWRQHCAEGDLLLAARQAQRRTIEDAMTRTEASTRATLRETIITGILTDWIHGVVVRQLPPTSYAVCSECGAHIPTDGLTYAQKRAAVGDHLDACAGKAATA